MYIMYLMKTFEESKGKILIKNNKLFDYFSLTSLDYLERSGKTLGWLVGIMEGL